MTRTTNLTPALQAKIVARIKKGEAPSTAAVNAGVSESAYYSWMAKGREGTPPYVDFMEAIKKARSYTRAEAEKAIRAAFTGIKEPSVRKELERNDAGKLVVVKEVRTTTTKLYPSFALSWLERQYPDEWAPVRAREAGEEAPSEVTAGPAPEYSDPWEDWKKEEDEQ